MKLNNRLRSSSSGPVVQALSGQAEGPGVSRPVSMTREPVGSKPVRPY